MLLKSTILKQQTTHVRNQRYVTTRAFNSSKSFGTKFNSFLEKKREIDRMRWEKIKEISRTIDHIAKSDMKQTYDLVKELHPVVNQSEEKKETTELKSVDLADEETS